MEFLKQNHQLTIKALQYLTVGSVFLIPANTTYREVIAEACHCISKLIGYASEVHGAELLAWNTEFILLRLIKFISHVEVLSEKLSLKVSGNSGRARLITVIETIKSIGRIVIITMRKKSSMLLHWDTFNEKSSRAGTSSPRRSAQYEELHDLSSHHYLLWYKASVMTRHKHAMMLSGQRLASRPSTRQSTSHSSGTPHSSSLLSFSAASAKVISKQKQPQQHFRSFTAEEQWSSCVAPPPHTSPESTRLPVVTMSSSSSLLSPIQSIVPTSSNNETYPGLNQSEHQSREDSDGEGELAGVLGKDDGTAAVSHWFDFFRTPGKSPETRGDLTPASSRTDHSSQSASPGSAAPLSERSCLLILSAGPPVVVDDLCTSEVEEEIGSNCVVELFQSSVTGEDQCVKSSSSSSAPQLHVTDIKPQPSRTVVAEMQAAHMARDALQQCLQIPRAVQSAACEVLHKSVASVTDWLQRFSPEQVMLLGEVLYIMRPAVYAWALLLGNHSEDDSAAGGDVELKDKEREELDHQDTPSASDTWRQSKNKLLALALSMVLELMSLQLSTLALAMTRARAVELISRAHSHSDHSSHSPASSPSRSGVMGSMKAHVLDKEDSDDDEEDNDIEEDEPWNSTKTLTGKFAHAYDRELARRKTALFYNLLRSPIFDRATLPILNIAMKMVQWIPLVRSLPSQLITMLSYLNKTHFYTAASS